MEEKELYQILFNPDEDTDQNALDLIKEEEDINILSSNNENYLHIVARGFETALDAPKLVPVVFQLSFAGIIPNVKDTDGNTPLHVASKKFGSHALVRALIMIGCDPTITNSDGQTPLQLALDDDLVQMTLTSMSPGLWQAVHNSDEELVLKMVAAWCKIDEKRDGKKLMDVTSLLCGDDILLMFENKLETYKFAHAAMSKDKKRFKKTLKYDIDVNIRNDIHINHKCKVVSMPLVGELAILEWEYGVERLLKSGADVNVIVDDSYNAEPLFFYLMRTMTTGKTANKITAMILEGADFNLVERNQSLILDIVYDRKYPKELIQILVKGGLKLYERDKNNFSLRDRIYLQNYKTNEALLQAGLAYVDKLVIDMALADDMATMETMVLNSFDFSMVTDEDGRTLAQVVLEEGTAEMMEFIKNIEHYQVAIRKLHHAIQVGNFSELKQNINKKLAMCRDKGGRSLLHKAIIYERNHIIKYLVKDFKELLTIKDNFMRTPLHWAVCLEDETVADLLKKGGVDIEARDKNGLQAVDYRYDKKELYISMLAERNLDHGIDVYLLEKYNILKKAISAGDIATVERCRAAMYRDITIDDIHKKMYRTDSDTEPRDLISLCVDYKRDEIGKYFLSQGAAWDVKYLDPSKNAVSLLSACEERSLSSMREYIEYQRHAEEELKKQIQEAKKNADEVTAGKKNMKELKEAMKGNQSPLPEKTEKPEKKSCACVML